MTASKAVAIGSLVSSFTPKKPGQRKRRALMPQSLLILHLDAEKLHQDGLYLGDVAQFSAVVATLGLGSRVVHEAATSHASLMTLLANLTSRKQTFDVIVIIGHSNANGIKIAADWPLASWSEFAAYLKPLRPRRLLLAACQAGRWSPGTALFEANRHLRRIFACPVNASKDFATMMLLAVPYVVAERRPKAKDVLRSQIAAIGVTGRQLRHWTRTKDNGNPESAVLDLLADVADPIARRVPGAIEAFVKTMLGR